MRRLHMEKASEKGQIKIIVNEVAVIKFHLHITHYKLLKNEIYIDIYRIKYVPEILKYN